MTPPTTRRSSALLTAVVSLVTFVATGLAIPGNAAAQSVLERTPNLSGGWVGSPGQVHFNFLHRFQLVDGGDESIVVNTPSFLLAAPLPGSSLLGMQYATSSATVPGQQNEWELFGRWAPLEAGDVSPVDVSLTGAYNTAASSVDGEIQIGLPLDRLRLLGVARVFSDQRARGESGWAGGGGAVFHLTDAIALAGDVVSASDLPDTRTTAWGAGIQLQVPLTPHTLSLQATNTRTGTLLGSSEGFRDPGTREGQDIVWGFEFTIPFTLSRYFGDGGSGSSRGDAGAGTATDRNGPDPTGSGGDRVGMTRDLRYAPATLRVTRGTTVTWENTSRIVHTVTLDPDRAGDAASVSVPEGARPFHSGDLEPGETFSHTFDIPGEFLYFCVPHEAAGMIGTIVVTD